MTKTLSKVGIQGVYLSIIKAMYDKPTANNGEKYEGFSCKIRNKTRMPSHHFYSTLYWNSYPQQLARNKKQKESKSERKKENCSYLQMT